MKFRHMMMAGVAVLLAAGGAAAKEDEAPSKRFTADRVFDMEYASDPQVSPDGKTVAYVRHSMDRMTDKDTGQIWILNLDDGSNRPLVTGVAGAGSPRWSPDGTRIVYSTATDGKPEVRLFYLDTGRSFPLAQFHEGPSETVWSPDGTALAIAAFDHPEEIAPSIQWGTEGKLPYVDTIHELPGKDTMADLPSAHYLSNLVSYQHPDHDTDEDWRPGGDR